MASIRKRKRSDGTFAYEVVIRLKGKPFIGKTFDSMSEALIFGAKMEEELKTEHSQMPLPLSDYIDRYLSEVNIKHVNKHLLECWKDFLGRSIATQVTDREIDLAVLRFSQIITRKNKPPSKETNRKFIFSLSAVYTKAIKEWKWCKYNPVSQCSLIKKFRPDSKLIEDSDANEAICAFKNLLRKEIESRTPEMNVLERAKKLGISKSVYNYMFLKTHSSSIHTILKVLKKVNLTLEIVPIKDYSTTPEQQSH